MSKNTENNVIVEMKTPSYNITQNIETLEIEATYEKLSILEVDFFSFIYFLM